MTESIARERGKRAGNILLAQVLVSLALNILSIFGEGDPSDYGSYFVFALIGGGIAIAISFILISPLKNDNLPTIRTIYIILGCIEVALLYFSVSDDPSYDMISAFLGVAVCVLVIIALYTPGKAGKICCFFASGLSLVLALLSLADSNLAFSDFVSSIFSAVYYVFLGLYIESKGSYADEHPATATSMRIPGEQSNIQRNDYEDLVKLRDLMENGVITPAEYEAKKKQILGL